VLTQFINYCRKPRPALLGAEILSSRPATAGCRADASNPPCRTYRACRRTTRAPRRPGITAPGTDLAGADPSSRPLLQLRQEGPACHRRPKKEVRNRRRQFVAGDIYNVGMGRRVCHGFVERIPAATLESLFQGRRR
jgi:hypothetical protein